MRTYDKQLPAALVHLVPTEVNIVAKNMCIMHRYVGSGMCQRQQ